jgi:hypothetical protein
MLRPALVLDADMLVKDAIDVLLAYPDFTDVVIRRREGLKIYWYIKRIGDIRYLSPLPEMSLKEAFQCHEYTSDNSYQRREVTKEQMEGLTGVLVDGERFLGILEPQPQAAAAPPKKPASRRIDVDVSGFFRKAFSPFRLPKMSLPYPEAPASPEPEAEPVTILPYPSLDAPERVTPAQEFTLEIGLSKKQFPGVAGGDMAITTAEKKFDLVVNVFAEAFEMPDGARHTLHVQRECFWEAKTKIRLIAPIVQSPTTYYLEVEYSHKGNLVGKGWRSIYVAPIPETGVTLPEEKPVTGAVPITMSTSLTAPDLRVTIKVSSNGNTLSWSFDSPHPVTVPSTRISTKVGRGNAMTYALEHIMSVAQADGTLMIDNKVRGLSREIGRNMPYEFWKVLADVWRHMKNIRADDVPAVLLISEDPYIPWELASTEKQYIDESLTDASRPLLLGAQVKIGRWLPQGPSTPQGTLFPKLMPDTRVNIQKIALVIGDYAASVSRQRPLPEAIKEGEELKTAYSGIHVQGTLEGVNTLLDNKLEENGKKVAIQAIHFACHGSVSQNPQFNGIILSDTVLRLGVDMIAGNMLTSQTEPFVFLNACQLGQASEILADYGGMAGAFLTEGCRGFIAPLWSVDDKIAHKIGVEFYKKAITEHNEVSEIMRDIRSEFDLNTNMPPSTYLAYTFYGHPKLILDKPI